MQAMLSSLKRLILHQKSAYAFSLEVKVLLQKVSVLTFAYLEEVHGHNPPIVQQGWDFGACVTLDCMIML